MQLRGVVPASLGVCFGVFLSEVAFGLDILVSHFHSLPFSIRSIWFRSLWCQSFLDMSP